MKYQISPPKADQPLAENINPPAGGQKYIVKIKNFRFFLFAFCFVILLFTFYFLLLQPSNAQSLSLAVSPPVVEILIKPGKTVVQSIKLISHGDTATVTPQLFIYDSSGIRLGSTQEALLPWLSFIDGNTRMGDPFVMKAGETREIKLKISPPKDLPDGEFYRVLLFSTSVSPGGQQSETQVSQSVGTVFLLTVSASGELKKTAAIVRFDVPTIHDSLTPLTATIFVHNGGTTFFHPNGTITVEGPSGKAEFPLVPSTVLAGQTQLLTATDQTDRNVSLKLPGLYLGRYRIGTTFRLDEGSITVSETKTIYAVPWKLVSILSGVCILIFVRRFIMKKRRGKKKAGI